MSARESFAWILALFFLGTTVSTVIVIRGYHEQNRSQKHALLCFDTNNNVTFGNDFKECRLVAIRELSQ